MSDSEDEGSVYSDAGSGRNEGGSDVSMKSKIKYIFQLSYMYISTLRFLCGFKYTTQRQIYFEHNFYFSVQSYEKKLLLFCFLTTNIFLKIHIMNCVLEWV